jgi:acetylornithine deacetylase/succinyl-diaminopimelate desuccinylase-like protein
MNNEPKYLILFTLTALLTFSGLTYFLPSEIQQRGISSISEIEVDPLAAGELCARDMANIALTQNWKTDKASLSKIEQAFTTCLSEYIKIKTVSPKGNEEKAVVFFEQVFSQLDYAYKIIEVEDLTGENKSRFNILATLPVDLSNKYDWSISSGAESIILLNHMDVVGANPSQWQDPSLVWSGKIAGSESEPDRDFIWGRGSLDMKSVAITEMISMHLQKLQGNPLKRDIHFLAVADEEQSGSGAIGVIKKMVAGGELASLADAALLLNEGGGAIAKTPNEKWNLFLLAVEEKGGAWLDVTHPTPQSLLQNLNRAKIIDIKKYISRKEKIYSHSCSLKEIETPNSKVNVIASSINIYFDCQNKGADNLILSEVFKKNFNTVETKVESINGILKVNVQTRSASHGSTGINESALDAVSVGLHRLGIIKLKRKVKNPKFFKYIRTNATKMFVKTLSKSNFVLRIAKLFQFIPFIKNLVLGGVEEEFGIDGLFRTTCQFSALNYKENNPASALVDCRLVHTAQKYPNSHDHAGDFRKELLKLMNDRELGIDILDGWNVSQSSVKSSDFKKILSAIKNVQKEIGSKEKTMITPFLFPAGSDSTWFRNPWSAGIENVAPIPSYGFFPAFISPELLATFHGVDERFPVDQIRGTVIRYEAVLRRLTEFTKRERRRIIRHNLRESRRSE